MVRLPDACGLCRRLSLLFFALIVSSFIFAGIEWTLTRRRTELQAILTRMNPYFTKVVTNPPNHRYYGVWRYHDFAASSHRPPTESGFPGVPIVYVHGNAGCFQDMRSVGRFINEGTVLHRRRRAINFKEAVKKMLFDLYKQSGRDLPKDGEEIPLDMLKRAEDAVISETPMLAVEGFGVDFLEESSTQSGIVLTKEAIYLNHSVSTIFYGFLDHYRDVLNMPEGALRREQRNSVRVPGVVRDAEEEYIASQCARTLGEPEKGTPCALVRQEVKKFSSTERVRREVERVRREGIWLWTESLGGTVAVVAAIMAPDMYAGLIMAGAPVRYPPFFFDSSVTLFQRIVHDSLLMSYGYKNTSTHKWEKTLNASNVVELMSNLNSVPSADLAARLARVSIINIHGGVLEDIVPTQSSLIMRSTGRRATSVDHNRLLSMQVPHAGRRDVCTEELRGCGVALTHRGLVYALQLMDTGGFSLVHAALVGGSRELVAAESNVPPTKERLFPTVVETVPRAAGIYRSEKFQFTSGLSELAASGGFRKENDTFRMSKFTKLCVDDNEPLNLDDIPTHEDSDAESWTPLHIFVGATTFLPDDVQLPELVVASAAQPDVPMPTSVVQTRVATVMHLPVRRKDSVPPDGSTLRTAVSFQALRTSNKTTTKKVRLRFCFLVEKTKVSHRHFSLMQHDVVDPLGEVSAPDRQQEYLVLQRNKRISVTKHGRFAIVRNMRSISMETNLSLKVQNTAIFPFVICGSLRSFKVSFRGTEGLALDEPESQQQYFFGPYNQNQHTFTYSWRPFHTTPFSLANVYVVYTLTGDVSPALELGDIERLQTLVWYEPKHLLWQFQQETMRWVAALAIYSGTGKFAGCYILVYIVLYVVFNVPRFLGDQNTSRGFIGKVCGTSPTIFILLTAVLMDLASTYVVETALTVCLNSDFPLRTDEELTAMMSFWEKAVLLLVYALPPRYEACKYSWIRMLTIVPADVTLESVVHLLLASFLAPAVVALEYGLWLLTWPLSAIFRFTFRMHPSDGATLWPLVLLWCVPLLVHLSIPWLHVCITTSVACVIAYTTIWLIPNDPRTPSHPQYRWLCFLIVTLLHLTSHFEGLVLNARNYIMVPRAVLSDSERFTSAPEHVFAFAVVQCSLAVVYGTVYLARRHAYTMGAERAVKQKKRASLVDVAASTKAKGANKHNNSGYLMGDIGRRCPRIRRLAWLGIVIFGFLSFWVSIVSLRRPLEGAVALYGMCTLALCVSSVLLRRW
ncbi:hypothetical protein ERJ75_001739000 [Trypanosoma vivax]|nr:hypothetical protein ERJ75_001739000 [Trypanosoma vivax]